MVLVDLLPILDKDAFLAEYLLKEFQTGHKNSLFFPLYQTTLLCNSFSHGPTLLVLARYKLVVLRLLHCCPTITLLSSFFTPCLLSFAYGFCRYYLIFFPFYSLSRLRLPTCTRSLWRMVWACWACLTLYYPIGLVGLSRSFPYSLLVIPTRLAHWAFCLIPSSLGPFKNLSHFFKRAISLCSILCSLWEFFLFEPLA